MGSADMDMAELAEEAQGNLAVGIDSVAPDAVVSGWAGLRGAGFDPCVEGLQWRLPVECPMWSQLVVIRAEAIDLKLE